MNKVFLKNNTIFGALIASAFIVAAVISFVQSNTIIINAGLNNAFLLLTVLGLYFGVRKYRTDINAEVFTYSQALGACLYISMVFSLIYSTFAFFMYKYNPVLIENYIEQSADLLKDVYGDNAMLNNMLQMLKVYTSAWSMAFSEFFGKMFNATLFSLLISLLLRKRPGVQV